MVQFSLNAEQIEQFHRDGFLFARQLFNQSETLRLREFAKTDRELAAESYVRRDQEGAETRLALRNDLEDESLYTAVVRSSRVADAMAKLLGDEVYHYHHKMMLKEPLVGGAWEWHQDYGYWYNFGCLYPDMGSCMIAVDEANQENGCLQVLRGSHQLGRIDHGRRASKWVRTWTESKRPCSATSSSIARWGPATLSSSTAIYCTARIGTRAIALVGR